MKDERKTKQQLISELSAMRRQLDGRSSTAAKSDRSPAGAESSEDRFKLLFNHDQDALFIIDARTGGIIDANRAAETNLGYKRADLAGRKLKDFFRIGSAKDTARLREQLQIYGTVFTRTYPHPDGTNRILDLTAAIIPWDTTRAILVTARDVSERKAAEDRLTKLYRQVQKSHDDFLSILNKLNLGILTLDEQGRITFSNRAAHRMSGTGRRKIIEKKWNRALPFLETDIARIEDMLRRPPSKRSSIEAQFELPGGKRRWLEAEILDDPRDTAKKIITLNDVSQIYNLRHLIEKRAGFQDIVGKSDPMQAVFERIQEVSTVDWTVLIDGETGTGKELVARAIHATSHRKGKPFIAVNCAGLEDSLLTSQLFGHRRGAFTGAVEDHRGFFEVAGGGTLFLDEIGDISARRKRNHPRGRVPPPQGRRPHPGGHPSQPGRSGRSRRLSPRPPLPHPGGRGFTAAPAGAAGGYSPAVRNLSGPGPGDHRQKCETNQRRYPAVAAQLSLARQRQGAEKRRRIRCSGLPGQGNPQTGSTL
jgi:PAS domain S-box-containing protein